MSSLYIAEYACGNRVTLPNADEPPAECPNCGADYVEGFAYE